VPALTREPDLRGKLGATLAAASSQNGAAGAGTHTQTKTVDLGTATVIGLKRALAHDEISSIPDQL